MNQPASKAGAFRALHESGIFVVPNPWDLGSALVLQSLGFKALASTSSGLALTLGRRDGRVSRDEVLRHGAALAGALDIPLTADLENGFGDSPETVAQTIRLAAEAGLAGGSIEDYTGNPAAPLYSGTLAAERVAAATEAAAGLDRPFVVTARAEQMLRASPDLDATIARLVAYEEAGADVLYAPGLTDTAQVREILAVVRRPLNVLIAGLASTTLDELGALGVRRVSTGGALARACVAPLLAAGHEMLVQGRFGWLKQATPAGELDRLLPPDG